MNLLELQDFLRRLSDAQLRDVVRQPASPIEATLAVGTLQERNAMRAGAKASPPPQGTVAERVVAESVTGDSMGLAVGMADGGRPEDAEAQWFRLLEAVRGVPLPGQVAGAETLPGAFEAVAPMIPDRYGRLAAAREEYEGGSAEREENARTMALLRLGAGLMESRDPTFLGALGEAGGKALPAVQEALALPHAEQAANREWACHDAAHRSALDAARLRAAMGLHDASAEAQNAAIAQILSIDDRAARERMVAMQMAGRGGASSAPSVRALSALGAQLNSLRNYQARLQAERGDATGQSRDAIDRDLEAAAALQTQLQSQFSALLALTSIGNSPAEAPPGARTLPGGSEAPGGAAAAPPLDLGSLFRGTETADGYAALSALPPGATAAPIPGAPVADSPRETRQSLYGFRDGQAFLNIPGFGRISIGARRDDEE